MTTPLVTASKNEGVMVLRTLPGYPAESVLRGGDYLLQVDETPVHKAQDLLDFLNKKKAGDTIQITYRRDKASFVTPLTLSTLPAEKDAQGKPLPPRPGLGFVPGDVQSGVGRAGGEMAGQRPGERLGNDVVALGVDAPAAPDVLVEQALVDEPGQGGLHRDRRMPVDELPQRGDRLGQRRGHHGEAEADRRGERLGE